MEKKNTLGVVITMLLVFIGVISLGLSLSVNESPYSSIAKIIIYAVIIGYVVIDFKIPHTNILRFIMLIYALSLTLSVYSRIDSPTAVGIMLIPVIMTLVGYMSGRLNKLNKNIIVMVLVLALFVIVTVYDFKALPSASELEAQGKEYYAVVIRQFANINVWLALCTAYITRFKGHKEAGTAE